MIVVYQYIENPEMFEIPNGMHGINNYDININNPKDHLLKNEKSFLNIKNEILIKPKE